MVMISAERLAELEALEKRIPDLIQETILNYKKENLKKLHEKDKNNPEAVKLRVQRYIMKNKDKINEKRREKRKGKALAAQGSQQTELSTLPTLVVDDMTHQQGLTVRFND
jgi:hypothetical protein